MGIEHRCLLRYRIETQNTKVNLVELDDVLEEYKNIKKNVSKKNKSYLSYYNDEMIEKIKKL